MTAPRPSSGGRKSPPGYSPASPAACVTGCSPPTTPAAPSSRRMFTAAVHPHAGLTAPSEDEDKQAAQRRTEAVDAAWAAIEAAPPPSPAELDHARHAYRDTSPVQQTLFDDPPQDSTQDGSRATASRPPRPAPSGRGAPDGAGRPSRQQPPRRLSRRPADPARSPRRRPGPPQPLNPPLPPRSTIRTRITLTRAPAQKKTSPPRRPAQPQHPPAIPRPRPVPRTPRLLTTMTLNHRRHRPRTATSRSPCTACPARS